MIKLKHIIFFILIFYLSKIYSQTLYNNGNNIWLNNSAIMQINGDIINAYGDINLTKNNETTSELHITGNLINNSTINANGIISIIKNWYNNASFESQSGIVLLAGTNQLISGSVSSTFYNLKASSDGLKTLEINQYINGKLDLYNSEFNTQEYILEILNTSPDAIITTNGYVSSDQGGFLARMMQFDENYVFPVGSHTGTDRIRFVNIKQSTEENSRFLVRFINHSADNDSYPTSSHDTLSDYINTYYYHQINRTDGNASVKLEIEFEEQDGNFNAISNWDTNNQLLWRTIVISYSNETTYSCMADSIDFDNYEYFALSTKAVIEEPVIPIEPIVPEFNVYNSFSPNGDNYNDTWVIDGIGSYPNCNIKIFNRNGNLIFNSDGYQTPWDGKYKNDNVPDATYYYIIDLYGDGNNLIKGGVTIIR